MSWFLLCLCQSPSDEKREEEEQEEEEEEKFLEAGLRQPSEAVCSKPVSCSQVLRVLIWIVELQEPRQVWISGWVMEPGLGSLRGRFSICTLLICAQVVALFCLEDRNTGESHMFS